MMMIDDDDDDDDQKVMSTHVVYNVIACGTIWFMQHEDVKRSEASLRNPLGRQGSFVADGGG
jgi:hypothetical protein